MASIRNFSYFIDSKELFQLHLKFWDSQAHKWKNGAQIQIIKAKEILKFKYIHFLL